MPKTPGSPGRQRYVPRGKGPVTSKNKPVAGSEYSVNNARTSLLYEPNVSGNVYRRYFGDLNPNHIVFFIFDDPYRDPSTYSPTIDTHTLEDLLKGGVRISPKRHSRVSVKRGVKFTDGEKHDVISVRYKGKQHKVKFQGSNPVRDGMPYFYIEEFLNGELHKVYGDFSNAGGTPSSSQQADFGKKRCNSELRYLKRFV